MEQIKVGRKVDASQAKKIANTLVDELCRNHGTLVNLSHADKGRLSFNHSVNVCILATMTGISLSYDELRLRDLGVRALLHDVGKLMVPPEILSKTDRLTLARA